MKRLISCIAMLSLLLFHLFAQTFEFRSGTDVLYFDDEEYTFSVLMQDALWPLVAQEPAIDGVRLRGAARVRAASLFSAMALESSTGKRITLNSGNADEVRYELIENGVQLQFYYDEGLMVPLLVAIDDSSVRVSIDSSAILESEDFFFLTIQLLPFLSAASIRDVGAFLIPDGSGALLKFNNGKKGSYNEPVYGRDLSVIREVRSVGKETIRLPLYGIEKNGSSLLVFAEEGAAMASIIASPSNNSNPYNTCYFQFNLRMSEEQAIASDAIQVIYESPRSYQGNFTIRLRPAGDSGYVSIAKTVKDNYLPEISKVSGRPFILNVIGAELIPFKLFGIPTGFDRSRRVCGYRTIHSFIESLSDLSLMVNFESWNSDQLHGRPARSMKWDGSLGSRKERNTLLALCKTNDIPVSLELTPLSVDKRSGAIVRNLSQQPASQYLYHYASAYKDEHAKTYLLNLGYSDFNVLQDMGVYPAFKEIGTGVYSDFSDKHVMDRNAFADGIKERLKELSQPYVVYGGNYYTLSNAFQVLESPNGSSGFDILDDTVPFFQMVLSGNISYASDSINTSERPDWMILNAFESGSCLSFTITDLTDLAFVKACLETYGPDIQLVAGQAIVAHEILPAGIRCTTYENGIAVTVDYTNNSYQITRGDV